MPHTDNLARDKSGLLSVWCWNAPVLRQAGRCGMAAALQLLALCALLSIGAATPARCLRVSSARATAGRNLHYTSLTSEVGDLSLLPGPGKVECLSDSGVERAAATETATPASPPSVAEFQCFIALERLIPQPRMPFARHALPSFDSPRGPPAV